MFGLLTSFLILISWFVAIFLALTQVHLTGVQDFAKHIWLFFLIDFLYVGIFIISHDACHGSVVPSSPKVNLWIGRVSAFLYGGFIFDRLKAQHSLHHINSGHENDPDFHGSKSGDENFFRWITKFTIHYFSIFQFVFLAAVGNVLMHIFKIPDQNVIYFWIAPSILSALQLFYFGTYIPHKVKDEDPFADHHRARNSKTHWFWSLLTCYHFGGFHRVHHEKPFVPWYRLPNAK